MGLKQEEKMMEDQIKVNAEAVESLIRILSKNLDQQLFNKANEIQEEISKKRYDLRCYQIKLSGIRAQKQLYDKTEKQEGDRELTAVQSGGASAKVTGKIKSKWVNAFKNVKGQQNNQAGQPYDKSTRINKQNELQLNQRLSPRGSVGPDQKRQNFVNSKPPSAESQQLLTPPNEPNSGEASPIRRKMGGSYSRYTGVAPLQRGLTIEGDLVDTSGRKINTSVAGNGSNGSNGNGGMTL